MGLALGAALVRSDAVERLIFYGRDLEPPPHPLFEGTAEYRPGLQLVPAGTNAVILAVPDDALAEVAYDLAQIGPAPDGCAALHLAGALSTDVLAPLHRVGYAIGSLHPLQTIADRWSTGDPLVGAAFALAGDPVSLAAARRLVTALEGNALLIPPMLRPVYHAAAVFASNYLVSLTATAAGLLERAGVEPGEALPCLLPLLRGSLDSLERLGLAAALTGPIARGDTDTVRLHLARLSAEERGLYCALGRATLRLARAAGLDATRAAELESLLAGE